MPSKEEWLAMSPDERYDRWVAQFDKYTELFETFDKNDIDCALALNGSTAPRDVVDPQTGEVYAEKGKALSLGQACWITHLGAEMIEQMITHVGDEL